MEYTRPESNSSCVDAKHLLYGWQGSPPILLSLLLSDNVPSTYLSHSASAISCVVKCGAVLSCHMPPEEVMTERACNFRLQWSVPAYCDEILHVHIWQAGQLTLRSGASGRHSHRL